MRLSGRPAWLIWGVAHIYFLIGFRSRLVVALDWLWAYVTFRRGARIIRAETAGAAVDFPLGAAGPGPARAKTISND